MSKAQWYEKKPGKAQHLVYLDSKANELKKLLSQEKTMIIRGASGRKSPLGGRAAIGDDIFFVETNSNLMVSYKGIITNVIESEKMTEEESIQFIHRFEKELQLSKHQYERWSKKKFLAVYEIGSMIEIPSFQYKREANMDDWIITENIEEVK